jgi:putative acetyltransferase
MVELRPETPDDAEGICCVHLRAFPTSLEADLVDRLRRDGDSVISIVALEDGAIVGHILFSRMKVEADGRSIDALGLAPVAVVPEHQHEGIGGKLIEAGLKEARSLGTETVFVVGDPGYYGRFGFRAQTAAPFASPYASQYFQAKELSAGFTPPISGRATYAQAFAGLE